MQKKVFYALKKRHLLKSLSIRLRIVLRISNKNVYAEYLRCKEYSRLEKKYKEIIKKGVNVNLEQKKSNIIWICWLQGLEFAPDLVKACVQSVKRNMIGYDVRVLTEGNLFDYVSFPDHVIKKYKKGIIPSAQFTDILRTALLCKYGGGWVDATVYCTCEGLPDYIKNAPLFVYKQIDLFNRDRSPVVLSNWLIFSVSNHPIMLLTLDLLFAYWKDHNSLSHYFIYHLFFTMASRRYPSLWNFVPTFDNHSPHILQKELGCDFSEDRWKQIKRLSDFHKLNRRLCFEDGETFYSHIIHSKTL